MASPLTPKQWLIVILVNVVVSAVTTLVIVRVMLNQPVPKTASSANVATQQTPSPITPTEVSSAAQAQTATPARQANAPTARPTMTPIPTITPGKTSAPTLTAVPANIPSVRISTVLYPGQRQREVVVIVNEGNEISLKGWTITSSRSISYTFADVTLFKDSFINLHTTTGADVPTDLFWNRADPAWQTGDVITLANKSQVIATYTVK